MSQQIPTSEVLNLAADYLDVHGLFKGDVGDDGGPRCTIGAIRSVVGEGVSISEATCPAYAALRTYLGGRFVSDWSDERTASEVIEVLRAAAVIESAREQQDAAFETYAAQVSA